MGVIRSMGLNVEVAAILNPVFLPPKLSSLTLTLTLVTLVSGLLNLLDLFLYSISFINMQSL